MRYVLVFPGNRVSNPSPPMTQGEAEIVFWLACVMAGRREPPIAIHEVDRNARVVPQSSFRSSGLPTIQATIFGGVADTFEVIGAQGEHLVGRVVTPGRSGNSLIGRRHVSPDLYELFDRLHRESLKLSTKAVEDCHVGSRPEEG